MKFNEFIGIQEDAVSEDNCRKIISFFESNKNSHTLGVVSPIGDNKTKSIDFSTKKSIDFCRIFTMEDLPEQIITECFKKYIPNYQNKFDSLDRLERWQVCMNYNIRKYEPGMAFYKEHCEVHGTSGQTSKRMLVWMLYLNDVLSGGETYFRYQDLKVRPETGKFLIWPPYWTHPHYGLPSEIETKYIATGWFEFV